MRISIKSHQFAKASTNTEPDRGSRSQAQSITDNGFEDDKEMDGGPFNQAGPKVKKDIKRFRLGRRRKDWAETEVYE